MSELKLTKKEFELLDIVRKAVKYSKQGDPLKDFIDQDQIVDALVLLVKITKPKK